METKFSIILLFQNTYCSNSSSYFEKYYLRNSMGLFGNIVLVMLFKCYENTYE